MISVISEKEKTSAEWKKRQQERLRDEQEGYLEEIDFRVTLAHGKAKTSLYGAGWGVENIRGKVTGSTFTGSSEADSAKVFTTEHGEVSGNITYLLKGKTKWDIRAQARKHGLKGYGEREMDEKTLLEIEVVEQYEEYEPEGYELMGTESSSTNRFKETRNET
jgi:hypothetical protein